MQQQGRGAFQCCRNFTDSYFKEETGNGVRQYIRLSDLWYIRTYFWKAIAPEPSNGGTPNLELKVRRVCSFNQRPHPLPVIYAYGARAFDYTCRPSIHYLLYMTCEREIFLWICISFHGKLTALVFLRKGLPFKSCDLYRIYSYKKKQYFLCETPTRLAHCISYPNCTHTHTYTHIQILFYTTLRHYRVLL